MKLVVAVKLFVLDTYNLPKLIFENWLHKLQSWINCYTAIAELLQHSGRYIRVQGTECQRGDSCPDLKLCQGGDCIKYFRSRGGIVLVWKNFQVRTAPKRRFFARSARKISLRECILSWSELFQRGDNCPDLDFFRGGMNPTFLASGGGIVLTCHWPLHTYDDGVS